MCKFLFFIIITTLSQTVFAQNRDEIAIRTILAMQTEAWNKADIEGFMNGYWQSDSLSFIGSNGLKRGWTTTLNNYKKSYPTPEKMGKLDFTILKVEILDKKHAYVVGKWHLARSLSNTNNSANTTNDKKPQNDDLQGHFTLLWRKIKGKWVIVSDHSS